MNLNELREELIRKYPDRTIWASATCRYSPTNKVAPRHSTTFQATIWQVGQHSEIACQVTANTRCNLIAAVDVKLADPGDVVVEVDPEGETQ